MAHDHNPEKLCTPTPAPKAQRLELAEVRKRLSAAKGKQYWRTLEEIADTPGFRDMLEREFPRGAAEWTDGLSRRNFLKLMGASMALAGITACTTQPDEAIVPYVRQPEEIVLGKPLFFATAMTLGGVGVPLLVESHEGRPTKIEGNDLHPATMGATDVFNQASILDLYDPDRSQTVQLKNEIRSWGAFMGAALTQISAQLTPKGSGLRILTETIVSPSIADQLQRVLQKFPNAKWYQFDPVNADNENAGAKQAFGQHVESQYQLENANVILALDSDFLACGGRSIRLSREFASRRKISNGKPMNRFYAVGSTATATGAKADHHLPLKPSEIELFVRALASQLGIGAAGGAAPSDPKVAKFLAALLKDLQANRGTSAVIVGDSLPPAAHVLGHAINDALGNVGKTVVYTDPLEASPTDQLGGLKELVADMEAGKVQLLFVLGGNPLYNAPADLDFADAYKKVPFSVHLSMYEDETSAMSTWHVNQAHYLESWGDTRAYDGSVLIQQPLIAPLYNGKTPQEVLTLLLDKPGANAYEIVKGYWQGQFNAGAVGKEAAQKIKEDQQKWLSSLPPALPGAVGATGAGPSGAGTQQPGTPQGTAQGGQPGQPLVGGVSATTDPVFEAFWRKTLHDGVMAGTAYAPKPVKIGAVNVGPAPQPNGNVELVLRPDQTIYDGRFANNGWLQELPKPLTRMDWDNALLMSTEMAQRLNVVSMDVVEIEVNGRKLETPIWILPGHADQCATLTLGYGRQRAGRNGTYRGVNAYLVQTSDAPMVAPSISIRRTGGRMEMTDMQNAQLMQGRDLVREASMTDYQKDPRFAHRGNEAPPPGLTLYPQYPYTGYAWGMAIDMNSCVGCNACVVACIAENNIAVVGKDEVKRGRIMHWLRIDTYYSNDLDNPRVHFQPVPCMQCENAPCEVVCPVEATVHSSEGLNDQVYNRCVGTRYCSNNCPYKVRRFNFFLYSDFSTPSLEGLRNPNVTVRSRGVMEKCTYCVQRINEGRIHAEEEERLIRDLEVKTACQQACPTNAIVFGNINDANSQVSQMKSDTRNYGLLEELNTRPRTTYLAEVWNPNPELEPEQS